MAFIFSTSHLPESLVRRPDHLEDEEEEDDVMRPMPRAGGVRAFSHLPQPVRAQADFEGPLSTRPATPAGRPRPHTDPDDDQDTGHAPAPESGHDDADDTAPQDHADDRPWYMPRITAKDLPPQDHPEDSHAPTPKPWENTARSSGFDDAPPAASSTRDSGFSPSPQDLRDDFHAPTPDSPTREAPAQDSRPALTRGRIFEKRLPPGLRGQGTGQFQSLADKPEYHDMVYRPSSAEHERHQADGFLQNVADTRTTRPGPSASRTPQTFAQSARPAARPQAQDQSQRPATNPAQNTPSAAPPPPKLKRYFVFPRGANVVILYNKKAVGNIKLQYSNGTTMEQQALGMIQDHSGATTDPRLIDISDPGWVAKLDALAAKNEGGFTHLVILDHGYSGNQYFGRFPGSYNNETALTPQSTAWKIISSVMAPDGHIHLGGCRVGQDQEGQNYLNELLKSLGIDSKITIDAVTGPMLNLSNAFEGDIIRAQPIP
jgi:hypothetical protein